MPGIPRAFYSNDTNDNPNKGGAHELVETFRLSKAGNITADETHILFVARQAGKITEIIGFTEERGVDASNTLQLVYTVLKFTAPATSVNVASTEATITKAAAAGLLSTRVAATGVTPAVVKTDGSQEFAAGDIVQVTFDITRTASPGTEIKGVGIQVGVKYYKV